MRTLRSANALSAKVGRRFGELKTQSNAIDKVISDLFTPVSKEETLGVMKTLQKEAKTQKMASRLSVMEKLAEREKMLASLEANATEPMEEQTSAPQTAPDAPPLIAAQTHSIHSPDDIPLAYAGLLRSLYNAHTTLQSTASTPSLANSNYLSMKKFEYQEEYQRVFRHDLERCFDPRLPIGSLSATGQYGIRSIGNNHYRMEFVEPLIMSYIEDSQVFEQRNVELLLELIEGLGFGAPRKTLEKLHKYFHSLFEHLRTEINSGSEKAFFDSVFVISHPLFCSTTKLNSQTQIQVNIFQRAILEALSARARKGIECLYPDKNFTFNIFLNYVGFFSRHLQFDMNFDKTVSLGLAQRVVNHAMLNLDLQRISNNQIQQFMHVLTVNFANSVDVRALFESLVNSERFLLRSVNVDLYTKIRTLAEAIGRFPYIITPMSFTILPVSNQNPKQEKIIDNMQQLTNDLANISFYSRTLNNPLVRSRIGLDDLFNKIVENAIKALESGSEIGIQTNIAAVLEFGLLMINFCGRNRMQNELRTVLFLILNKPRVILDEDFANKKQLVALLNAFWESQMLARDPAPLLMSMATQLIGAPKRMNPKIHGDLLRALAGWYKWITKPSIRSEDFPLIVALLEIFKTAKYNVFENHSKETLFLVSLKYKDRGLEETPALLEVQRLLQEAWLQNPDLMEEMRFVEAMQVFGNNYAQKVKALPLTLTTIYKYCYPLSHLFENDAEIAEIIVQAVENGLDADKHIAVKVNEADYEYKYTKFDNFASANLAGFEYLVLLQKKFDVRFEDSVQQTLDQLLVMYVKRLSGEEALESLLALAESATEAPELSLALLETAISAFYGEFVKNENGWIYMNIPFNKPLAKWLKTENRFKRLLNYFHQYQIQLSRRTHRLALALMFLHNGPGPEGYDVQQMDRLFEVLGGPDDSALEFLWTEILASKIKVDKLSPYVFQSLHFRAMNPKLVEMLLLFMKESIGRNNFPEALQWLTYCVRNRVFYRPLFEYLLTQKAQFMSADVNILTQFVKFDIPGTFAAKFFNEIIGNDWISGLPSKDILFIVFNMLLSENHGSLVANSKGEPLPSDNLMYLPDYQKVSSKTLTTAHSLFIEHAIKKDTLGFETWNPLNEMHYYKTFDVVSPPVDQAIMTESFNLKSLGLEAVSNLDFGKRFTIDFKSVDSSMFDGLVENFVKYYLTRYYFHDVTEKYNFSEENIHYLQYSFEAVSNAFWLQTNRRAMRLGFRIGAKTIDRPLLISQIQILQIGEKSYLSLPDAYKYFELDEKNGPKLYPWCVGRMFWCIETGEKNSDLSLVGVNYINELQHMYHQNLVDNGYFKKTKRNSYSDLIREEVKEDKAIPNELQEIEAPEEKAEEIPLAPVFEEELEDEKEQIKG